jgi:hypothetical protein
MLWLGIWNCRGFYLNCYFRQRAGAFPENRLERDF